MKNILQDDEEFITRRKYCKNFEEEALPEEKIILNDKDQEIDLFNELMKNEEK